MTWTRGKDKQHLTKAEEFRINRRTVIDSVEFDDMLEKAGKIENKFFRLRTCALLCILKLVGKRRGEVALLELANFKVENNLLNVTFELEKKRKHFKICPDCEMRNTVKATFCTKCGVNIEMVELQTKGKQQFSTKAIPLADPLTKPILEYLDHLKTLHPPPRYFLPQVKTILGKGNVLMTGEHIKGRQVFNLVRNISDHVWPHLFRETVASDVVKTDSSIYAAYKVQDRLDLVDYRTGFGYVKRFAIDVITRPQEQPREATS